MAATWLDFWQQENEFDDSMMANYAFFLDRAETYAPFTKSTRVLDIGSGPGNLEDAWYSRVGSLDGLDISARYNAVARAKHAGHANVHIHDIPADDYLNFSPVAGKQFDLIVVMSVVQYYRNAGEVEQLLANIKAVAAPGAKALLCDLIVEEGVLGDMLSMLGRSLRQGKLLSMLRLMFRLRFSRYYTVRQQNGMLTVPEREWLAMCARQNINAHFIDEPLTLQPERKNLLLQF